MSTALSLAMPYLSKDLVDRALLGRDFGALVRILTIFGGISLASFALNAVSGLRYTRVSADILFDMRLSLYTHLQRLSPRFYAHARLGDIMSRINNDIGEIQRIAAETALAWVGNVLFLAGSVAVMVWLDWKLFLVSVALVPASVWALGHYRRRLEGKVATLRQSSAEIGNFLIETVQGMKLVVTSNAQERERERFRRKNESFVRALMSMQLLSYLAGGLPGLILSGSTLLLFLYGGHEVIQGTLKLGVFVAFLAYQMRLFPPIQALMGLYAGLATARVSLARVGQIFDTAPEVVERAGRRRRCVEARGDVRFEDVTLSFGRGGPVLDGVSFEARAGRDAGDRGTERQREIDDRRPGAAAARSGCRHGPAGWRRCARVPPGRLAASHRAGGPGAVRIPHEHRGELAVRAPRSVAGDNSKMRRGRRGSKSSYAGCRWVTRRKSASAERRCRRASGSASRLPARFWQTRRCWYSTSRLHRSIRFPNAT